MFGVDRTHVSTPLDTDMITCDFEFVISTKYETHNQSKRLRCAILSLTLNVQIRLHTGKAVVGTDRLARRRADERLVENREELLEVQIVVVLADELSDRLPIVAGLRKRVRGIVSSAQKVGRNSDLLSFAQRFERRLIALLQTCTTQSRQPSDA